MSTTVCNTSPRIGAVKRRAARPKRKLTPAWGAWHRKLRHGYDSAHLLSKTVSKPKEVSLIHKPTAQERQLFGSQVVNKVSAAEVVGAIRNAARSVGRIITGS